MEDTTLLEEEYRVKVLIAPDSFKGSLSAKELCGAIAEGIRRVYPGAELIDLPLADGGEGTTENLVHASGGKLVQARVSDPLGRTVQAAYGLLGEGGSVAGNASAAAGAGAGAVSDAGSRRFATANAATAGNSTGDGAGTRADSNAGSSRTAVIEVAQASGLTRLTAAERNPLIASSRGTGELIARALDAGCRRFIVGLGGSATNDGGAGLLQALGLRLLDASGAELPPGGAALARLARIDASALDPRLRECRVDAACDVANPLCGPDGASAVFGPQKGATPAIAAELDAALRRFGELIERERGIAVLQAPGAGAAGGIGAALLGFLGARMRSGIEMVLEAVGWERHLRGADLVITGEGKLDAQTLSGKVIAGVCKSAWQHGVPVVALCGGLDLTGAELERLGVAAAFSIVRGPCPLDQALDNAAPWAAAQAEQIMRLLLQLRP
jgi:glycerate kinase